MPHSSPHRRAFTLLELLAAISIVVVLASLLLPTVKTMQSSARSASCMSNLRNIGVAFKLYAADNNGYIPALRWRKDRDNPLANPSKKGWQAEINAYLNVNGRVADDFKDFATKTSGQVIFCPQYTREFKTSADAQALNCAGYGMNEGLGTSNNTWDVQTSLMAIPKPATTILVGDSDDYHLNISATTWASSGMGGRFGSGDPIRHGKMANYLFVDGHVAALNQRDALAAFTGKENP